MNRQRGFSLAVVFVTGLAFLSGGCGRPGPNPTAKPGIRVGTYNSSMVALAYGRSERHNQWVRDMVAKHKQAEANGDTAAADAVDKACRHRQELLHRQVFGDAPIDNVLALMPDDMDRIAAEAGVVSIVAEGRYEGPSAEFIDVTDAMTELFDPSAKTREYLQQLRKRRVGKRAKTWFRGSSHACSRPHD